MQNLKHPTRLLLLTIFAATALPAWSAAQQEPKGQAMTRTPGQAFVLDFSGSPNGGVSAGNFNNFGFILDPRAPARRIVLRPGEPRQDVIASYDYADCTRGQEALLERAVRELPRSEPAWVDRVDIEMIPFRQKQLKWEGGVCYGYRTRGAWHWRLATTPLVYDAATDRVRARVWIKEANIDALKLVFDYSVPRQLVRTVTVTTQTAPPQNVVR